MVYYNEYDLAAAEWLTHLIDKGLIPYGDVDTRSILDVSPEDLKGYTQCHFFAGIGGWAYALNLINVSTSLNLWTGSCPCQPFSSAGKKLGFNDERDLWGKFYELIKACRPKYVFGEQVSSAIAYGWLDRLTSDLGSVEYACASAILEAQNVGAPHVRKRLYWGGCQVSELENSYCIGHPWELSLGSEGGCSSELRIDSKEQLPSSEHFWSNGKWTEGSYGKGLLLESGSFPLVNGVPNRVVKLRGYGNAIVPQVAAAFVRSFLP